MKVRCIEHVDKFNEKEYAFWLEVDDVPKKFIEQAKIIDGEEFLETCFGICIMCNGDDWCICQDDANCELFYIDNEGEKHWLEYVLNNKENNEAIKYCRNNLKKEGVI